MQAYIKQDKIETEQERQKRLDDTFKDLKIAFEQRTATRQLEIRNCVLKVANNVIQEYIDFLEYKESVNKPFFKTFKTFSFRVINNDDNTRQFEAILDSGHRILFDDFRETLKSIFYERDYVVDITYDKPQFCCDRPCNVHFNFRIPNLK